MKEREFADDRRKFAGVWIPATVYLDRSLSWSEKLMLVEINSFSKNGRECFVSNEHLQDFLGLKKSATEKVLKSLCDKGLVVRSRKQVGKAWRRTLRCTTVIDEGLHAEIITGDMPKKVGHTNTTTNSTTNTTTKKGGKPSTFDEVVEYFMELGMAYEEAQKFYDWYEQTGWKLKGGNSIKDWKATARNWKRRNNERQAKSTGFNTANFNPSTLHNFINHG